jgi:hypothetical protein
MRYDVEIVVSTSITPPPAGMRAIELFFLGDGDINQKNVAIVGMQHNLVDLYTHPKDLEHVYQNHQEALKKGCRYEARYLKSYFLLWSDENEDVVSSDIYAGLDGCELIIVSDFCDDIRDKIIAAKERMRKPKPSPQEAK